MDIYSLTPTYFEWVVEHMADLAIKLATAPRTLPSGVPIGEASGVPRTK
jgi:hypothetical protein